MWTLRPIQDSDLQTIFNIQSLAQLFPWSQNQVAAEIKIRNKASLLVMNSSGVISGYIFMRGEAPEFELISIGVEPKHQRQGLGKVLWEGAVRALRPYGSGAKVFLEVQEFNQKAIQFYVKHGFKQVGIRPRYYPDGSRAMVFQKVLDP